MKRMWPDIGAADLEPSIKGFRPRTPLCRILKPYKLSLQGNRMLKLMKISERSATVLQTSHHSLHLQTVGCLQFIDITDAVSERVRQSGVRDGLVNVQTKHTTTAILVNEHEPLLLEDLKKVLERLAPQDLAYRHNDFSIRTANLTPEERENGHSHCKALFLRTSETLNLADGALQLGQWQRIFFIELDGARKRTVSVMILGCR